MDTRLLRRSPGIKVGWLAAYGPQAAVLEINGWDTHANQAAPKGPIARNLQQLDAGLTALRDGLVPSGLWDRTVVVAT